MESNYSQMNFEELKKESEKLFNNFLDIRRRRDELKLKLGDMGCECDGNACVTHKKNKGIDNGDSISFCHDDQDWGKVNVTCLSGRIKVVTSAAVWNTYETITRKELDEGEDSGTLKIPEQDRWFDQTNRVEIFGLRDNSRYDLLFYSFDD